MKRSGDLESRGGGRRQGACCGQGANYGTLCGTAPEGATNAKNRLRDAKNRADLTFGTATPEFGARGAKNRPSPLVAISSFHLFHEAGVRERMKR